METLFELTAYHWLVLGLLLLGAEALGTAGFLLGAAVAALATGIVVLAAPTLPAGLQLAVFAVGAVLASYLYLHVFRSLQRDRRADGTVPEADTINQRAAALLGHRFELSSGVHNGEGRVQIGDTFWHVRADAELAPGETVEVVDADAMRLTLARVQ